MHVVNIPLLGKSLSNLGLRVDRQQLDCLLELCAHLCEVKPVVGLLTTLLEIGF